jgi:GPH family glycoside/pentoside/hexuronide:cation symporter
MDFFRKIIAAPRTFANYLTRPNPNGEITKWRKFLLSFPSLPAVLSNVLIHNAFIKFYTDIIGLDPKYVGIIYLIFGIWNAINDPAIGVLIDRFKFTVKRGKFVYLMKVTAPITVLSALGMVFAQPSWNQWLIFAFFLVLLFIYDTSYTTYNIAKVSYVLVAAPSSKERVDVAAIDVYVGNIGGLLGTLIPTLLLVGESKHTLTIVLFAAVLIINSFLYFIALKPLKDAKEMYLAENKEIEERKSLFGDLYDNGKAILKSKAFITYILYQLISRGPKLFYFTPFLYVMDYVLRLKGIEATIVDIIPGIVLFLLIPLATKFIKKIGLKNATILATIPGAIGFLLIYFIGNFWQAVGAYVIMYLFTSIAGMTHTPLLGAVIDEDEQRTGIRKAGLFNGMNALLTIPVSGIQAAIFTSILSAYKFVAGNEEQSARAIQGIKVGAGLIPFVLTLVGIIPLLFFPINKNREQELSDFSIQQRHKNENDS